MNKNLDDFTLAYYSPENMNWKQYADIVLRYYLAPVSVWNSYYLGKPFDSFEKSPRKISIEFDDLPITGSQKKDLYEFVGGWLKDNDIKQSDGRYYYYATENDITDLPITINFEQSQLSRNEQRGLTVAVGGWLKSRELL